MAAPGFSGTGYAVRIEMLSFKHRFAQAEAAVQQALGTLRRGASGGPFPLGGLPRAEMELRKAVARSPRGGRPLGRKRRGRTWPHPSPDEL